MRGLRVGLFSALIVLSGVIIGSGQPKFPNVFVVPHDYKDINVMLLWRLPIRPEEERLLSSTGMKELTAVSVLEAMSKRTQGSPFAS